MIGSPVGRGAAASFVISGRVSLVLASAGGATVSAKRAAAAESVTAVWRPDGRIALIDQAVVQRFVITMFRMSGRTLVETNWESADGSCFTSRGQWPKGLPSICGFSFKNKGHRETAIAKFLINSRIIAPPYALLRRPRSPVRPMRRRTPRNAGPTPEPNPVCSEDLRPNKRRPAMFHDVRRLPAS